MCNRVRGFCRSLVAKALIAPCRSVRSIVSKAVDVESFSLES